MARRQDIGQSEDWFIGEDKTLPFEVYDGAAESTIIDVTGWAMEFRMRLQIEGDRVVLTRTTGGSTITITGSFNANPTTNTQRVNVLVEDTDTDNLQPGRYYYVLRRTDAGNETVLAYGDIALKKAA
jgi:hypothetical protein